jgi:GNAT superfamily N-acetyltransferase
MKTDMATAKKPSESVPSIIAEPDPPKAWVETIQRALRSYNTAATGIVEFYPVVFLVKDAGNNVLGGVPGNIVGGWMHIRSLWVDKMGRGRGYATELMAAAERYATQRDASQRSWRPRAMRLDRYTRSWATGYLPKLSDHPSKGHERYFLTKRPLSGIDAGSSDRRDDARIVMQPYASNDTMELINRGIHTHANASIGLPEQMWSAANLFLRSDDGEILCGALGNTWGLWLYVSDVWVDPSMRGKGYATKLMNAIEQMAAQRGCVNSYLDTFSFQARPLYEKLGYKVFGTLENHPKGHSHYFLKKTL